MAKYVQKQARIVIWCLAIMAMVSSAPQASAQFIQGQLKRIPWMDQGVGATVTTVSVVPPVVQVDETDTLEAVGILCHDETVGLTTLRTSLGVHAKVNVAENTLEMIPELMSAIVSPLQVPKSLPAGCNVVPLACGGGNLDNFGTHWSTQSNDNTMFNDFDAVSRLKLKLESTPSSVVRSWLVFDIWIDADACFQNTEDDRFALDIEGNVKVNMPALPEAIVGVDWNATDENWQIFEKFFSKRSNSAGIPSQANISFVDGGPLSKHFCGSTPIQESDEFTISVEGGIIELGQFEQNVSTFAFDLSKHIRMKVTVKVFHSFQ